MNFFFTDNIEFHKLTKCSTNSSKTSIILPLNGHWARLTAHWMQKLESDTLNCYGAHGDLNSALIRNWIEVTRLFGFCKILLSKTCLKNSPWQIFTTTGNKVLKKLYWQSLGTSLSQLTWRQICCANQLTGFYMRATMTMG